MKKIVYLLVIVLFVGSMSSCASKRKGCGLTADTTSVSTQNETLVAEVQE